MSNWIKLGAKLARGDGFESEDDVPAAARTIHCQAAAALQDAHDVAIMLRRVVRRMPDCELKKQATAIIWQKCPADRLQQTPGGAP